MASGSAAPSSLRTGKQAISYIEAMRIAEEREAQMRATFSKFDLDQSGTVDMDELLVLLDDLRLMSRLKSEPQEFVRDMFLKFDANMDGVLGFDEFVGFYNAALDDCLGRRRKEPAAAVARADSSLSTAEARKKLAFDKAAKKAAEAARIQKQNAEMKARILAQAKGRDSKELDEEVEKQRRQLAEARAAAKAAEKARIDAENRERRERIRNTKAITDDDIADEVILA